VKDNAPGTCRSTQQRGDNEMQTARQIAWSIAIIGTFVAYGMAWRAIL
jgi:hypothetical protein